jgi:hypothetical protein
VDLLKFEYGMSMEEIRKFTRRELSELIEAMVSRKQGYQETSETGKIEQTDEIRDKILKARKNRLRTKVNGGN